MMSRILILSSLLLSIMTQRTWALETDPNGYFKDRQWTLKNSAKQNIQVTSEYKGEPVQRPNSLQASIQCGKKTVWIVQNHKYCGIDAVQVIGNILEIHFADYNPKDPRGYCTRKNQKKFTIPSCDTQPESKSKKAAKT